MLSNAAINRTVLHHINVSHIDISVITHKFTNLTKTRSNHLVVFCKKVFLKILQNSLGNTCVRAFFNKVPGLRPATLLRKRPWHRCFPVNFTKFLRIPFL